LDYAGEVLLLVARLEAIQQVSAIILASLESIPDRYQDGCSIPEGKEHLIFDTAPNRRWTILKRLDDGYLGSTMTKLKYEINGSVG
jgi:hypothetical protein